MLIWNRTTSNFSASQSLGNILQNAKNGNMRPRGQDFVQNTKRNHVYPIGWKISHVADFSAKDKQSL